MKKLLEFQPLITDPKYGKEPSIIELIEFFYKSHGMENWKELRDSYIKELEKSNV